MPLELARTLLVKGQVHRRRREKRLADQALRESLRLFDQAGAALWSARVRTELARIGLRPRAPTDLTETEARVAALAADGMTNAQVAKAAFISPKTVDNVLARVYRKLGISSRAQLGVVLAAINDDHGDEGGIPTHGG
jgi:DNA-binding CsgD family transcriptional regulator